MCSTCDYRKFEMVDGKLEQSLGMGSLIIRYDSNAKSYKLAVKNEPRSEFVIYRCPTCGGKLG